MNPEERSVQWSPDAVPWVRVIQGYPRRISGDDCGFTERTSPTRVSLTRRTPALF
jgi:hypothetical protein